MIRIMARKGQTQSKILSVAFALAFCMTAWGQTQGPLGYSVTTPRPISPAEGTTTPSAQATQRQNPYLGSVPSKNTGTRIELSLRSAMERGLRYNLGLIEANQASADVRGERLRALSELLPQLEARARQGYEDLSYKEISEVTALSVSNIGFLIHTAIKSIRTQLLPSPETVRRTQ